MSQFEYTDLNKFYVSIGIFLIGFTFLLPWLYFQEDFNLLVKSKDLDSLTSTAQRLIHLRQSIVWYSQFTILFISLCSFAIGIRLCYMGINGWDRDEKSKRQASQLSNKLLTKGVEEFSSPEIIQESRILEKTQVTVLETVKIPINNLWILNHWGSDVASIENGKMIFKGEETRLDTDGCHINLPNLLRIGSIYRISCYVKAFPETTAKFQLWCHDNIGVNPFGSENAIPYATPSANGGRCNLRFEANVNTNLRIHLQYSPGIGKIEVNDVTIDELQMPQPV